MWYVTVPNSQLDRIRREGLRNPTLLPVLGHGGRRGAGGAEAVLVIDSEEPVSLVRPETILNLSPYRRPFSVLAAGGIVVRHGTQGHDVLLIHRKGYWDLPKGKFEPGETPEECAVREVSEEVGVRNLSILAEAGTTIHGYVERDSFAVKTTYWYLMSTPASEFRPETREGIVAVEWFGWEDALKKVGYDSLRELLLRVTFPRTETRQPRP